LRQSGFDGIIITDDLDMRGVLDAFDGNQFQACIAALNAGVDVLLFREAGEKEEALLHELARAVERGEIDATQHRESLNRIQRKAHALPTATTTPTLQRDALFQKARQLHQQLASVVIPTSITVAPFNRVRLLLPTPESLPHYGMDTPHHSGFANYLQEALQAPIQLNYYEDTTPVEPYTEVDVLTLAVVWLPKVGQGVYSSISRAGDKGLVLNIGAPVTMGVQELPNNVLDVGGWRPLQQEALAQHLAKALMPYRI
jgi:beta-glucosidase-like glycosyl hydrolase